VVSDYEICQFYKFSTTFIMISYVHLPGGSREELDHFDEVFAEACKVAVGPEVSTPEATSAEPSFANDTAVADASKLLSNATTQVLAA
jgi:hypothetical protein